MKAGKELRKTVVCVVDGDTEGWYLNMLKRNEPALKISIKPELPQKKAIWEQFARVKELSKDYSQVFWIVDMDTVIRESRQHSGRGKSPRHVLNECLRKLPKNVVFIANTPCLEFWFLLHAVRTTRYYDSCESVIKEMQKHSLFSGYEKTKRYFTAEKNDIYLRLKPFLSQAIDNARITERFDLEQLERGHSEMHKLFDFLGIH